MKIILNALIYTFLLLTSVLYADSANEKGYLPPRQDANVVDKNISKRIEVVFYRIGGAKEFVPTVKVNDKIVGSLMPDNYAKTIVCNRNIKVGVAERGDSVNITNYGMAIANNSNIVFIKVLESAEHKFTLAQVDPDGAKSEISYFKLKSNIINRHVPNCELNQTRRDAALLTPQGNALSFKQTLYFDTDSYKIRKKDIEKIKKLANLAKEYQNLTKATIESYTDYRGSKSYNKKLAYNRAISVKKYFESLYPNCFFKIINRGEIKVSLNKQDKKYNLDALLQPYRKTVISIHDNRGV